MVEPARFVVVVNPAAARGRTGRRWPRLERALRERIHQGVFVTTTRPGQATALVRDALRDGADHILSVGGDGTHYEVLNGFFEAGRLVNPAASLAVLAEGTGADIARSIGISRGSEAIETAVAGRATPVDVGRVVYQASDGALRTGYFLNVMHVGLGGAVSASVNHAGKTLGGRAAYFLGLVKTVATYRNTVLTLDVDGTHHCGRYCDLVIANGRYDGGGMCIAPTAVMNDGWFNVYVIGDVSRFQAFTNLGRAYRGTLVDRPDLVRHIRCRRLTVTGDASTPLGVEGEQPGTVPVEIEILPLALPLVTGPRAEAIARSGRPA